MGEGASSPSMASGMGWEEGKKVTAGWVSNLLLKLEFSISREVTRSPRALTWSTNAERDADSSIRDGASEVSTKPSESLLFLDGPSLRELRGDTRDTRRDRADGEETEAISP